jgi:hypothetical protein
MKPATRRIYYLIPVKLTTLVRRERLFREFQIWLLLKHWSNGHLEIDPRVLAKLAGFLQCSTRTIERSIKRLRERNWIGFNPRTNISYIRGIDNVITNEQINGRLSVWFNINRIIDVEAFLAASTDSLLIRQQKVRKWVERAAGVHSKRGTIQPAPVHTHYPVALSLHHFFGIAKSTAQRERKLAEAAGFLHIRKVSPIPIPDNNPGAFLQGYPELAGHIFNKCGKCYIRPTDEIQTNLLFKKRSRKRNSKS